MRNPNIIIPSSDLQTLINAVHPEIIGDSPTVYRAVKAAQALVDAAIPQCPEEFHIVYRHSAESEQCTLRDGHSSLIHESENFRWEEKVPVPRKTQAEIDADAMPYPSCVACQTGYPNPCHNHRG